MKTLLDSLDWLALLRPSSAGAPRLTATLRATLFAGASALAGCSPAQPPNPLANVDGFCQEKATAECQIANLCAIDPTTCTNARESLCLSGATSATASGVRSYDAANAQACIDAVNRTYNVNQAVFVPYATLEGPGSITDLCNRVFTGNLGINTTCHTDYDCSGSAICAPVTPGATVSVCAEAVTVAAGGFCDNPGSMCGTDLYCAVQTSGAAQCEAAAALGASCANGVACVSGALCGAAMTCVPREPAGNGCSSDAQCDPAAPYCDPASNVCAAGETFDQGGTDCLAFIHPGTGPTVATPTADAASSVDAAEIDSSSASDASSD